MILFLCSRYKHWEGFMLCA